MRYPDRATVCVSSQAGCGMACPFCATGQGGLQRNLSTAEIVEQVRQAAAAARDGALGEPGPAVQRRVHGHGRAAGQLQPGGRRRPPDHRARARTGSGSPRAASPSRRSASCPRSTSSPPRACPSRSRSRCTPPTTSCATPSCPSTRGGRSAEVLAAARRYADGHRAAGVDRVRADPRRQRPAVARRPARQGAAAADRGQAGARQPHPAQPDAGQRVGRLAAQARRTSSCDGCEAAGVACTVRDTRGQEIAAACGQLAAT